MSRKIFPVILCFALCFNEAAAQVITTICGDGTAGITPDGFPAGNSWIAGPGGANKGYGGKIYFCETYGDKVRFIGTNGLLGTVAGNGTPGYSGDGGLAINAQLYDPFTVITDNAGNAYIIDQYRGQAIRKVNPAGIITTIAGSQGYGYAGDGGPLALAKFMSIVDLWFDNAGNLIITDVDASVIRKVNMTTGIVTTIAGTGVQGFSGDGGPATSAKLDGPTSVVTDNAGNIYIADGGNHRIRKINTAGIITTIAGTGATGNTGDGGPATAATFMFAYDLAIDGNSNLYVCDLNAYVVRKITPAGIISRYAGNATAGYSGDGGPPLSAQIRGGDVSVDNEGNMYISDIDNNAIRKIYCPKAIATNQTAADTSICLAASDSAQLFVQVPYGTAYQWQLNSGSGWNNIANNATYSGTTASILHIRGITTAMNNYQYRCHLYTNCHDSLSAPINMRVNAPIASTVTINASANNICFGTPVTFTATTTNAGSSPYYRWRKNGVIVYSSYSPSFTTYYIFNGDVFTCEIYSSGFCQASSTNVSNPITMVVTSAAGPVISIAPSVNNICQGATVTFTATVTNPGTSPVYQWKKNGVVVGTNSTTYTTNALYNGDIITCTLTTINGPCGTVTLVSNAVTMFVSIGTTPTIYINSEYGCLLAVFFALANEPITFNAYVANGGSAPVYQWKRNGVIIGGNSSTYTGLFNYGDVVTCTVTSNSPCVTTTTVTSNAVILDLDNINDYTPSVTINASNTMCQDGVPVTFTANVSWGGPSPFYQWRKNGVNVGTNSNTYTENSPVAGDIFSCTILSNENCTTTREASAAITYNCNECGNADGIINTVASVARPWGIAKRNNGNIYVSSTYMHKVYMMTPNGDTTVIAGTGTPGYTGDGGPATAAQLYYPYAVAVANDGTVYVGDQHGSVLRKIDPAGIITTIANSSGTGGDGSPLGSTQFYSIWDLCLDNANNLYIADASGSKVKKANLATGITQTVAGNGLFGYGGDGGPATLANLSRPDGIAVDNSGNLYITDYYNYRIRKVDITGTISTFAGTGTRGKSGDGGLATSATLYNPYKLATDIAGNVYLADYQVGVRKINTNGVITRVAGNGTSGYSGDGGPATWAQTDAFNLTVDSRNNIYIVDDWWGKIRKVSCPEISINSQPRDTTLCNAPGNIGFTVHACNFPGYQWQVNTGSGWIDISDNAIYSGAASDHLILTGADITMNNYQYRCRAYSACNTVISTPAKLTVKAIQTPAVSIATLISTICQGANGIFTATPVNAGTTPSYQWKKNGINVGNNSNTYSDNTLVNGDQISCELVVSGDECTTTSTATSNTITVTVNPLVTPAITITPSANNICSGTPVTFTLTSANGGSAPYYQWQKNSVNVASGTTYTDNTLTNGDTIRCAIISNAACTAGSGWAFSNNVIINTVTSVTPTIAIISSNNNVCAGTAITFNSTITNGGPTPAYQWKKNGVNVGTNNNSYTDNTLSNGDVITCELVSSSPCATSPNTTSNGVTMVINPITPPSITVTPSSNTICAGTSVVFTSAINNGGATPVYQWKKNGVNVGTNSISYTDNALNNGDIITCVLTPSTTCPGTASATSNTVTMTVNPLLTPSVSITASGNTICAGTPITFSSVINNGGSAPVYQWKKNGVNVGTNNNNYTDNGLNNGDIISCQLNSNATCATPVTAISNNVTMIVNPLLTPTISIAESVNNICAGASVVFSSAINNGGTSPIYQWKKNGVNVGTGGNSYADNGLNNGDIITCELSSNALCAAPSSVMSNTISMLVNPLVTPAVTISTTDNSICAGQTGTFNAAVINGGSLPVYAWRKNGLPAGTNSPAYTDNGLNNGDLVTCMITSNANCLATQTGNSNTIAMTIYDNPVVVLDQTPTLCTGATRQLDAGAFVSYVWNTGQLTRTINVTNAGTYSVIVTDNNGCKGNGSSTITTMFPQPGGFLPLVDTFCTFGSLTLQSSSVYNSYLWNTGANTSSITTNQPGTYWLEVTDNNNCKGRSTVQVIMKQCLKGLYVPTAFTPNHDGKNDVFKAMLFGDIKKYDLIIYNRWGNIVYRTNDPEKGWDGTFKGTEPTTGVYVWMCSYQLNGEPAKVEKGTVTLIR